MKALEEKIIKEGTVLPGHILKVGSFLNQRIDTVFMLSMADEVKRLFSDCTVNKVLTMESSGIAVGFAVAAKLGVPLVFAKKNKSSNVSGQVYTAAVHSYTHNTDYVATVASEYLNEGDNVLIVDDFLANGAALNGLISIISQSGAELVGCAIAIEKGFQGGGDALREQGIRVESLAIVDEMTDDGRITFRKQN
jgi:xanthine phosphoribosyltransferase